MPGHRPRIRVAALALLALCSNPGQASDLYQTYLKAVDHDMTYAAAQQRQQAAAEKAPRGWPRCCRTCR